jgi:hypothetical protein
MWSLVTAKSRAFHEKKRFVTIERTKAIESNTIPIFIVCLRSADNYGQGNGVISKHSTFQICASISSVSARFESDEWGSEKRRAFLGFCNDLVTAMWRHRGGHNNAVIKAIRPESSTPATAEGDRE